ncbi:MAG: histidine phosphatase family protein [Armatimonadetes bacterium]|nr:histidine phosphatase family protein [Armatimonadota bacterium]
MVKMRRFWLTSCPDEGAAAFEAVATRMSREMPRVVFCSEHPHSYHLASEIAKTQDVRLRARRRLNLPTVEGEQPETAMAEIDSIARQPGPRTVAVVVETALIQMILCHLLSLPASQRHRMGQQPGAVNLLLNESGLWMIDSVNDIGHLQARCAGSAQP